MPTQPARSSQRFSAVVALLGARLIESVPGMTTANVQTVCAPDDQMTEYLDRPGLRIRVQPPDPDVMSGAGRGGYIAQRRVDVYVVTESLSDAGGRDDTAVARHLDAEDAVLDAITLDLRITKLVKWVPGGAAIARQLTLNPGLIVSVLCFVVTYVPALNVFRD